MSKDSSAKYHQNNKEGLRKKALIEVFLKKRLRKSNNMVVNDTKLYTRR